MTAKAYTDKRTPRTKAMRRIEDAAWKRGVKPMETTEQNHDKP